MNMLILGNSNIVQRRVLPALAELGVTEVELASRTAPDRPPKQEGIEIRTFADYQIALEQSRAELVYISTVNSEHAPWAERVIRRGLNVVVDKPAFTSLEAAERLFQLAREKNVCLAEATVYAYHPQIEAARRVFQELGDRPLRMTATFCFPPLPADNFRYRRELGGGALLDLGPYAVSCGRLFFHDRPQEIAARVIARGNEVETSFSMLATYGDGRSLVGHFGFGMAYQNRLEILGAQASVAIDRVFTTPADMPNAISVQQPGEHQEVEVPPADSFARFLAEVFQAVKTGRHESLAENMRSDAVVLDELRRVSRSEV